MKPSMLRMHTGSMMFFKSFKGALMLCDEGESLVCTCCNRGLPDEDDPKYEHAYLMEAWFEGTGDLVPVCVDCYNKTGFGYDLDMFDEEMLNWANDNVPDVECEQMTDEFLNNYYK